VFVDGVWSNDQLFIFSYTMLDGETELDNIDLGCAGASDVNGNVQIPSLLNNALTIDTRNPLVVEVSPAAQVLSDNSTLAPVSFSISFDDEMSPETEPQLSFSGSSAALTVVAGSGSWVDSFTYTTLVNVSDNNEEISDMIVTVSGGTDNAGNAQLTTFQSGDLFTIDTRNPILTEIATNITSINDGTIGSETFDVTLTFDESMDENTVPLISFDPIVSSLIPSTGSGWESPQVYVARFDVAATIESLTDIDISASAGSSDLAGNAMIGLTTLNAFDVDITLETAEQLSSEGWKLYPNPSSGEVVRLNAPANLPIDSIRLYTAVGALVSDVKATFDNTAAVITIDGLADGIYYVRIQSSGREKILPLQVIH